MCTNHVEFDHFPNKNQLSPLFFIFSSDIGQKANALIFMWPWRTIEIGFEVFQWSDWFYIQETTVYFPYVATKWDDIVIAFISKCLF